MAACPGSGPRRFSKAGIRCANACTKSATSAFSGGRKGKNSGFPSSPGACTHRLPARGSEHEATTLQNTNRSTVTVYYRFHAYAGQELEVIHYPVRRCEWVIVRTPRGTSLKIPQWMVQPSASEIVISPHAILSTNCLARLMELVPGPDLKEPSATVPETEQEGQSATASTQSRQRGEHRAGSNRRKATGRAHGEGDARGSSRKGDR